MYEYARVCTLLYHYYNIITVIAFRVIQVYDQRLNREGTEYLIFLFEKIQRAPYNVHDRGGYLLTHGKGVT